MAEDKFYKTHLTTASAEPDDGGDANTMVGEELADREYFCLAAENDIETDASIGLRFPIGLHVNK